MYASLTVPVNQNRGAGHHRSHPFKMPFSSLLFGNADVEEIA